MTLQVCESGVALLIPVFKALSDETRLRILSVIWDGELCVCEIEKSLNLTQSNASRHLTALKNAGILASSKHSQWTFYHISDKFKADNALLWKYLQKKIKGMPSYRTDMENLRQLKGQDLCECDGV